MAFGPFLAVGYDALKPRGITVPVKRGRKALRLPLVLSAYGKRTRTVLVVAR